MRFGFFPVMAGTSAGGLETYEVNLLRSLMRIDPVSQYEVFCLSRNAAASFGKTSDNVHCHILRPSARWISIPVSLPLAMMRSGLDLAHMTFVPPPVSAAPYVLTVHDFCMFAHPEYYPAGVRLRMNALMARGIKKARHIICVSHNTRDHVIDYFNLPSERVSVVYNGCSPDFQPLDPIRTRASLSRRWGIEDSYILFAGRIEPRKNVERLVEAYRLFLDQAGSPVKLVLAGKKTWSGRSVDAAVKRFGLKDNVIELGYVPDEELRTLFNGALLFAFPSLWEGFGLPVIEAMACGTPVLTSNVSSLPEIAGDAAILVDPRSPEAIAEGMLRLHSDAKLREELRARGLERARTFSWLETARQTLETYKRAATQ